jgi:hypothetical protein
MILISVKTLRYEILFLIIEIEIMLSWNKVANYFERSEKQIVTRVINLANIDI